VGVTTPSDSPAVLHQERTLYTEDGLRLATERWQPTEADVRVELLVVPGYADHAARYRDMAHALAPLGIALTALDPRGHGRSEGPRGHVGRYEEYHLDVRAALGALELGRPRFVLGHSQGALIVLDALMHNALPGELAGLVLTSPFLDLALRVPPWKVAVSDLAGRYVPRLALPSGLLPSSLSHDEAEVQAYARDPLVFKTATAGWFAAVKLAQARVMQLRALRMPLLLYYSPDDAIALASATARFVEQVAVGDKTVHIRAGEGHEPQHELERAGLFKDIGAWVLAHRAG